MIAQLKNNSYFWMLNDYIDENSLAEKSLIVVRSRG